MNEVITTILTKILQHQPLSVGEWLMIIGFVGFFVILGWLMYKAFNNNPD